MKDFINLIRENFPGDEWKEIEIVFEVTSETIGYTKLEYTKLNNEIDEFWLPFKRIRPLVEFIRNEYEQRKTQKSERFNMLKLVISKDSYTQNFFLDTSKELQDKLNSAKVFYQWLNDTMMNRIFDYEKEQELLVPNLDEDGDVIDYQSSYDSGVFQFNILNGQIEYTIELFNDGKSRQLNMLLPEYIKEAILEHYQITNIELQPNWEKWNQLTIKSPHNRIPYENWKDYVEYSYEV